jgi:hypothetical protein
MRDLIKKLLREEANPKVMAFFEKKLKERRFHSSPFEYEISRFHSNRLALGNLDLYLKCCNMEEVSQMMHLNRKDTVVKLLDKDGVQYADVCNFELELHEFNDDSFVKNHLLGKAAHYGWDAAKWSVMNYAKDLGEKLGFDDLAVFVGFEW